MPTTINLQGRLRTIRVPPGWQKPCKAAQWGDGVLAVGGASPLAPSWRRRDDIPVTVAPDGSGGAFVLTTGNQGWFRDVTQGPFALRPISATGKSAPLI